jgi:asparagine synthase (glutamine-hydrolysing)
MAGIAGIAKANKSELVEKMLTKMSHRGWDWHGVIEGQATTIGASGRKIQEQALVNLKSNGLAQDGMTKGHFAQATVTGTGFELKRDPIGVAPLYYGWTSEGDFCFASEVKGLLQATNDIHELFPGTTFDGKKSKTYFKLEAQPPVEDTPMECASKLRKLLVASVKESIGDGDVGSWLSGGIDSSALAAIARPFVNRLHTFSAGFEFAPDLEYARMVAKHIKSEHHELIVNFETIFKALPSVIYSLETFDALLIRSSILNYLVSQEASSYVPAVFSGEGGDELFAGYAYLKSVHPKDLPAELIDIIGRLHNTALQRVDRSASAFGTVAHVALLHPDVVDYALRIPIDYKIRNGLEKWVLRKAVSDLLPALVIDRPKAKFWQGGGFEDVLSRYADEKVSDADFTRERNLSNGWKLNTKEELLYYRIFREHFGELNDLEWMGRTKGAPSV